MSTQPIVCIVAAADKDNANLVWAAWGKGSEAFIRELIGLGDADEAAPTHYLLADSSTSVEDVQIIQGFANGDLPPISGAWGVDGVVEAADALAAIDGASLQCYSASGDVAPLDHCNAILASRNLRFKPAPL